MSLTMVDLSLNEGIGSTFNKIEKTDENIGTNCPKIDAKDALVKLITCKYITGFNATLLVPNTRKYKIVLK